MARSMSLDAPGRDLTVNQPLGRAAPHHDRNAVFKLALQEQVAVFGRKLKGGARARRWTAE